MFAWIQRGVLPWLLVLPALGAQAAAFEDNMAQRTLACTACHGPQGQAGPDGYYPRLAGKPAAYLYNQLINLRDGRRHYPLMAGLLDSLDDAYLHALADYFSALSVPYPAAAKTLAGSGELERGRQLVQQGDPAHGLPACTQCHGTQLTGVLAATPGLLGLPADYLNAQLGGWQSGQRHAMEPDCMAKVARQLSPGDTSAIARWLAAQTVPADSRPAARKPPASAALAQLRCGSDTPSPAAPDSSGHAGAATPLAERGAYLARLGNCASCHTARGGAAYAGGRAIATPFGSVYSSNLTPDPVHGLGRWSAEDFWRALHHGISRDGHALYPAFPYTSFTRVERADSDALFAFLGTLPAVAEPNHAPALRWPYSSPLALKAWRALFFTPAKSPPAQPVSPAAVEADSAWQRGRYLVQGLGHCQECHGTRNALGALSEATAGGGSVLDEGRWYAPSLGDPAGASVADWTVEETTAFLHTGHNRHAVASGPMAEVVLHGTQYASDADAQAMARYLKSLAPAPPPKAAPAEPGAGSHTPRGAQLYETHCADCHGAQGQGRPGAYPALAGNRTVLQRPPNNLINTVLQGGFGVATAGQPRPFGMPPFLLRLSDAELAALLTHVRASWGNQAPAVSEFDINKFRRAQAPSGSAP